MSALMIPSRGIWTQQPQQPVSLQSRFDTSDAAVFLASQKFRGIGGEFGFSVTNPTYTGPRFSPCAAGIGMRLFGDLGGNADDVFQAPRAIPTATAGAFTTVVVFLPLSGSGNIIHTLLPGYSGYGAVSSSHLLQLEESSSLLKIGFTAGNGYDRYAQNVPNVIQWDKPNAFVISSRYNTEISIAANGRGIDPSYLIGSVSYIGNTGNPTTARISTGNAGYAEYYHPSGHLLLWASLPGIFLAPAEAQSISGAPWQIFRAPARRIFVPVSTGAGAALSGNAQASAGASGALATGIPLAGNAAATTSASGTLVTQIPLSGAATVIATAAGDLATGITLEGHALAAAAASGTLSIAASLSGAALAVASASGTLSTQIPIAGAAVALATASGSLSTGIPLDGHAVAAALASGSLTAQIRLDGAALAQAAATAGLSAQIRLAGDAHGQASASGALAADPSSLAGNAQAQATAVATLTTQIQLSGSAAAQAGMSGLLTTAIPLTAAALAQVVASGLLTVPILLAGNAVAQASASGILSSSPPAQAATPYRLTASVTRLGRTTVSATHLATIRHEVSHA